MEAYSMPGGNCSIRRQVLEELKGVDENFVENAYHWELDLSYRIRDLGYKIIFDPQAKLIHYYASPGGVNNILRNKVTKESQLYFFYLVRNNFYCFLKHEKKNILFLGYVFLREYILNRTYMKEGVGLILKRGYIFLKGLLAGIKVYLI
jgi:GT2 family glycosyltransferase